MTFRELQDAAAAYGLTLEATCGIGHTLRLFDRYGDSLDTYRTSEVETWPAWKWAYEMECMA